jgi:hypothetical protein
MYHRLVVALPPNRRKTPVDGVGAAVVVPRAARGETARARVRELRSAMVLALIPATVGLTFGVLLLPRKATPDVVPLPVADGRALGRVEFADTALAERAKAVPLPGNVRALGSAIREFHTREAEPSADERQLGEARRAVDGALIEVLRGAEGEAALLSLRAVELDGFVREVHRFESTGEESAELRALAGAFARTLRAEGYWDGHALAVPEDALRPMFKEMWNAFLGLEKRPAFTLTLDEERALYAFTIAHAHPPKSMRQSLDAARRGARDARACLAIAEAERNATEARRLEHIARIGAIDPRYPTEFARGVVSYRRGDYSGSAQSFRRWLHDHPDGPLTLRAENYLRAAVDADRIE